jgi:hypothetical protein
MPLDWSLQMVNHDIQQQYIFYGETQRTTSICSSPPPHHMCCTHDPMPINTCQAVLRPMCINRNTGSAVVSTY